MAILELKAGRAWNLAETVKYLISDQGKQFKADEFQTWCENLKPRKIIQRFGAVGQHGSIALIERFIRSIKDEPWFETRGDNAVPLRLVVSPLGGQKYLPIVELEQAA